MTRLLVALVVATLPLGACAESRPAPKPTAPAARPLTARSKLPANVVPLVPQHGIYAAGGGLTSTPWRVVVDDDANTLFAGASKTANAPSFGKLEKEQTQPLSPRNKDYFAKMTLNPASVVAYYLGNEATFTQPRSYQGLLEITHFHLFAMGILVLTMTHLLLFVPIANRHKAWIVSIAFTTALADEASGWLVRFVSPAFAYLKVTAFVGLEAVLAFMVGAVLWAIWTAQPNDYRSSAPDDDE